MRISDWSSDVCSSDLPSAMLAEIVSSESRKPFSVTVTRSSSIRSRSPTPTSGVPSERSNVVVVESVHEGSVPAARSEEHTSELQSLMRISYAVFCLKKKNTKNMTIKHCMQ